MQAALRQGRMAAHPGIACLARAALDGLARADAGLAMVVRRAEVGVVTGFAIDESTPELGTRLKLPPWLERHRTEIEKNVAPLAVAPSNNP